MTKNKIYSFHKSVRGHMHVMRDIVCQDYSASFAEDNDLFHIAIVADGHGSSVCMRSNIGSKMVTEIAKEELESFASYILYNRKREIAKKELEEWNSFLQNQKSDSYFFRIFGTEDISVEESLNTEYAQMLEEKEEGYDGFSFPEDKEVLIRKLTDSIVFKWNKAVKEHFAVHPFTEEEFKLAGEYAEEYRRKMHIEHAYGTTLIASLRVKNFLILIQQGDGRCDVFYGDGEVDQPIPWDENCHENVTTSMCDFDADKEIRSCILDLRDREVVACYLGTDGVEDSYRDMEGTHVFYESLSCYIVEKGTEEFEKYLEEMLPKFSQGGSGDDISIAGIIDLEGIAKLAEFYDREIKAYQVSNMMQQYASKKISMTRKHKILRQKEEAARLVLEKEQENCREYLEKMESVDREKEELERQLKKVEQELAQEEQDVFQIENALAVKDRGELLEKVANLLENQTFLACIKQYCEQDLEKKKESKKQIYEQLQNKKKQIEKESEANKSDLQKLEDARQKHQKVSEEFQKYDAQYQEIVAKCEDAAKNLRELKQKSVQ